MSAPTFRPLPALLGAKGITARRMLASVRTESRLKVAVVSTAAVLVWLGIFVFARVLLRLLDTLGQDFLGAVGTLRLSDVVLQRLLGAFALAVLVLLAVSNLLVAFATLYRSREVAFLMQTPISMRSLFLSRFAEIVSFSSWALGFLGTPVLLAYGIERGAGPGFYLAIPVLFVPFVLIPAAVGTLACMLLVGVAARLPRALTLIGAGSAAVAFLATVRPRLALPDFGQADTVRNIVQALGRTRSPFLPSTWLADGLLAAAGGRLALAGFMLLLLVSYALLLVWLATLQAETDLYGSWTAWTAPERTPRARSTRRRAGLDLLLRPLSEPMRSLVAKDVRLFLRDPVQWSQFLIFFGLMLLYVANMKSRGVLASEPWRSWVAILNTSASMLILATLTTRFVFPLISLEGRRFWLLGLAPLERRTLVAQKFWLSVATSSVLTLGLALLSGLRLELDAIQLAFSLIAIAATTVALSGLAVGLGSLYPNLREDNPSRIVSGLGGTLNFILSFLFIAVVTAVQAAVVGWSRANPEQAAQAAAAALALIVVLAAATAWLPLRLGIRHLERLEL